MRHYPATFVTRALLVGALLFGATACSTDDIAAPADPNPNHGFVAGTLQVTAARPNLTLRNTTELIVGYMVIDKDMATVALFPPCGQTCPTIVQGASANVLYSAINGYTSASTEAIVMWWTYQRQADGSLRAVGAVNTTKIRL